MLLHKVERNRVHLGARMLRLLFTLVLALPAISVSAVFGMARRRRIAVDAARSKNFFGSLTERTVWEAVAGKKSIEQKRDYVPSWAEPED